jgi:hypothetical protein
MDDGSVLDRSFWPGDKGPSEAELAKREKEREKEDLLIGVKVNNVDVWEKVYQKPGKPIFIQKDDKRYLCFGGGEGGVTKQSVRLQVIPLIEEEFNYPFDMRLLDDNINWNLGYGQFYPLGMRHGGALGVGKISNKSKKRKNKRSKRYKRR